MLDVASPPARRTKHASWLDPRLLGGVLMILVSIVVGARIVAGADQTVPLYAASADLPAGHVIAGGDVHPVRVRMTSTSTYIAGGESVVGQVVTRDVRNDELVARSALVAQAVAPFREMSVSVKPEHIASGVDEGSTVDVIATSSSATGTGRTWTVARRLEVIGRAKSSGGFAAGDARVMLKVPAELVLPLTSAMHTADIDIVGVPALADAGDIGDEAQPASQPAPQK